MSLPHDPSSAAPTHELLQRYLVGDRIAEERLFERHRALLVDHARSHKWMRGVAMHVTPEDVVDEVFLRALSSGLLGRWSDPESGTLRKALFQITTRVLADTYRRHGTIKRGAIAAEPDAARTLDAAPSDAPTPTSQVRSADMIEVCRRALTEREWRVFEMRHVRGLEPGEVAAELGETPAAIRGVWRRARIKAAVALADCSAQ
ncbi:MAG: sigma-70 family RNA polymerase sigma factor [bacterium]|nr:sigma-70 family RNA polymerase sigma factor [bacterium]